MFSFHFDHRTSIFELCGDWFYPTITIYRCDAHKARRSKTPRKDVEDEEEESWTLPDNAKHTKNRPYSMYIFIRMKWWSHISKKKYYAIKLTRIRLIVKWIIPMCYQVLDFALTYVSELAGISRWASNSFFRVSYKFHIVFVWVSVFCWTFITLPHKLCACCC